MRLIVHGQQAFGKAVLEALIDKGKDELVAVYCAPDIEGRPLDPLKEAALERDLPVFQPVTYKDSVVWDQIAGHGADLCVMAYVTLVVPEEALNAPRYGSIQYHPSLLPMHKGPSSINWPIIFGSTKTGLSIFWPDNGLDTGPILLQREVEIGPDDTLGSLYFNHLFPMGVDAMLEAVDLVREGRAPKVPQDPNAGSYEGWCRKKDVEVDWSKPADQVYNLIRGSNPQPGAWTTVDGSRVQLFDSRKLTDVKGEHGTVIAADADGFSVAAGNGGIEVRRVRPAGSGKIDAGEFVSTAGIRPGTVLGG